MATYAVYEKTVSNGVMEDGYWGYKDGKKLSPKEALDLWEKCDDKWADLEFAHLEGVVLSSFTDDWEKAVTAFQSATKNLPFTRTDYECSNGNHIVITYTMK